MVYQFQEGEHGQHKAANWGSWPEVGGLEPATIMSERDDLNRSTTTYRI